MAQHDRTTRLVALAKAGRRRYNHALAMRAAIAAAQGEVVALPGVIAGEPKVAAPVLPGQAVVGSVLARFVATDPGANGVDVAIRLGQSAPHDATRRRLGVVTGRPCASPGWRGPAPAGPAGLTGPPVAHPYRRVVDGRLDQVRCTGPGVVERTLHLATNDVNPVTEMSADCGRLALLPDGAGPPGWSMVLPGWTAPAAKDNALLSPVHRALPRVGARPRALRKGFRAAGGAGARAVHEERGGQPTR